MTKAKLILITLMIASLCGCAKQPQYYQMPERVIDKTFVHKYGVTVDSEDWKTRGRDGKVISTLANGVIVTNNYKSGVLEGESSYSFPHSKTIAKVEIYDAGDLAKETHFYHSGTPKQEIVYKGLSQRTVTTWYETGVPSSIETYHHETLVSAEYFSPENVLEAHVTEGEGIRINRDTYGQLVSHETIKDGALVKCTTFHQNGTPAEVIPFHLGVISGERITYFPGGDPHSIEEWNHGKQHGITITFQNGEKVSEVPYKGGRKFGIERHYRGENNVVEEIAWVDNQRHGPSKTYVGDIVKIDWYFHGQKVSKTNYEKLHSL